jgi:hypothetical protein
MTGRRRLSLVLVVAVCASAHLPTATAQTKPEGEMRFALYVTLSPLWFDPAEVTGFITRSGRCGPCTTRS